MVSGSLFSSESDQWGTPKPLFDVLDKEFKFTLDLAANAENTKCLRFWNKGEYHEGFIDPIVALGKNEIAWCNPPHSKIKEFMYKIHSEINNGSNEGSVVVCLIPSRTDTQYWHDCCMDATEIRFIERRVSFYGQIKAPGQPKDTPKDQVKYIMGWAPAPFPSCIVVFGTDKLGNKYPTIRSMKQPSKK